MTSNILRACAAIAVAAAATHPLGAQGHTTAPGPLSQSVAWEAARMASTIRQAGNAAETPQHDNVGWSRVRKLRDGTEIVVTLRGMGSGIRYFDSATDTDLTIRDLHAGPTTIARTEVLQVTAPVRRGSVIGAYIGSWLGTMAGVGVAVAADSKHSALPLLGIWGGFIGGGFAGYRAASHHEDGVIYRAP